MVVAAGGQALGNVETLSIDSETWKIDFIQVKLSSEAAELFGVYWNYFHAGRIYVPTRLVHSVSDTVLLSVTVDELREVLSQESASATT
ncbi:PRC-barrel domain containing protein [Corallococcus exercitus]|uniref:PRC-barrel domain containing protein n=2 Tax=Corallococcus exercitus TaxID=2316736 RepID=A0A3A8I505_9BACT|nr:PRC-barrel domain containing protein [Corallococcus exercitus]RKG77608.1 PRC-barrel domain containing protein [Corallococcus exercitus]